MSDKESKTEEATPKRIRDAKKKGQVPKSPDLSPAVSLMVFTMLGGVLGGYIFKNGIAFVRNSLSRNYSVEINHSFLRNIFVNNLIDGLLIVLPFALIAMVIGYVVSIVQTGFMATSESIKPDFNRINPISGFKNIFSKKVLFNLLKNLLKLTLVFYLAYDNLGESYSQILNSGNIGTEKLFYFFLGFIKNLITDIVVIMLILAIIDYIFQRREFKKDLRMSKQEIKDEYKEMEGNPQIKSARQQRQRQLAMSRMMADVPTSTVVVTNPTHIAVALRYETNKDNAPLVIAKGADNVANKIKEIAKENKVPIIENVQLARSMYKKVEVGEYIPVELYQAVAEILALVYQLRDKNRGKI
ncbi:flagellar biosynthesis protein FlhB [Tissierella sp. Yu-01]|uniref:flagellar biosynthesis protein FlhB n=1 Tax=Tissierella sp. Yu-01 TaxID=3035694 RepID=UPI00240D339A|nr:flagellar biosynthesis protein FlhB [Tissierella sp. Yu-01]WFA07884.1 flagellar biosynthesis protein FlhB [Tissierella sp. Yu-01]